MASAAEALEYTCDSMQRLTRVTHPDGTAIDYVYDALGNRLMKTTTLPGAPSNQPPAAVTNPSIANGLTNVPTTAALSWSPAVDPNSGDSVIEQYEMKRRP
jgi:YD repeat-containing protein